MNAKQVASEHRDEVEARGTTMSQRLPFLGLLAAGFISALGSNFTAVAIPWIVERLERKGYQFVTIADMALPCP